MTELEVKQRKRRFWVWFVLTLLIGFVCFWSGYQIGRNESDNLAVPIFISHEYLS